MKSAEQKAKKVPTIRFAGFDDEWVNKIFGESFTYLQNNTLSRAELNSESGFAKNIHYGDVLVKFGECIDVSEEKIPFVSNVFVVDKFKNSFLQDGDIVIADTAEDETVGKCTEMQGVSDAILLSGLHTIPSRPKEKYGAKFLGYYLNSSAYHRQLLPLMQGVKVLSISKSALQETNLVIPKDNQEQQKIGSFFSNIDSLISLEQKKYDKLTQVKKSMLEKMFPKEGATVPEIRFAGFTGDWEKKKLGNIGIVIDPHPSHRAPKEEPGGIPFIGIGDVDAMGVINRKTARPVSPLVYEDHHKRYDLSLPSLGLARVASLGKVIRLRADVGKYAVSPTMSVIQFNKTVDVDYVYSFMSTPIFQKQFEGKSNGSTRQSVGTEMVRILDVNIPPNINEQQKIGSYFSRLDSLISLQQRKLEKLKNIKKSLLEKMFV